MVMEQELAGSHFPARHWHGLADGRIQCDVCPRFCKLHEGQRGLCFVRARAGDAMVLTTYGRSSGFCVDPIEKKPLNHFLPGTPVLSFGTAGCNLTCKFCQNWDISKAREIDRLNDHADPEAIAAAAVQLGCRSVAFTYNDPVIFLEYAIDTAKACRAAGLATVAVTAGYVAPEARREFFAHMDAANVDLKAFTEHFYRTVCGGHLEDVLDTLLYLKRDTSVWFEITTLLIPGENDSDGEIDALSGWVASALGPDVPLHFTAFHPDWKMRDKPATSARPRHRTRQRRAICLYRQRPRQGGRQHLVPRLRRAVDRARLVRPHPMASWRRRALPELRNAASRRVRAPARQVGTPAPTGTVVPAVMIRSARTSSSV